jgi:putative nucleotidyltransferase with HDIG domain
MANPQPLEPMTVSRDDALSLMHEYTQSDALRKHMLAVEAAMRTEARKYGEDEDLWGIVGILHDFDYERFPNDARSPTEEHPSEGVRILEAHGVSEAVRRATHPIRGYPAIP